MKIALCAGHYDGAKGAINERYALNEHDEASKVVDVLSILLQGAGHRVSVFSGKLSRKIANINAGGFDLALDIHFNAGGGHGCEVVYVPGSQTRKAQAGIMSSSIVSFMGNRNRGAKEGWYMGGSNPGTKPDAFVSQTNCPAFIPEPLFIDNDEEAQAWFVDGRHDKIAYAILLGITDAFGHA